MNKFPLLNCSICDIKYEKLGDAVQLTRGSRLVRNQLSKIDKYPVYQNSLVPLGYYSEYNCEAKSTFIICAGAAGEIGYSNSNFWAADDCFYIKNTDKIDSRYIYHVLLNKKPEIQSLIRKASIPRLSHTDLENIVIPIPPVIIQKQIASTLDCLKELIQNLTDELDKEQNMRKDQYEYYRNKILSNDSWPIIKIKDVLNSSCSGATPSKNNIEYYENGTIPWLRTSEVLFNDITKVECKITEKALSECNVKLIPENCVIVAISGATAGRCGINKIRTTTNQHCLNLEINSEIALYRYVYYCIENKYDELLSLKQGPRGDLNSSLVKNMEISLPHLSEQKRIVELIDSFKESYLSLQSELSTEIDSRKKQYEYYQNILLSFKTGDCENECRI